MPSTLSWLEVADALWLSAIATGRSRPPPGAAGPAPPPPAGEPPDGATGDRPVAIAEPPPAAEVGPPGRPPAPRRVLAGAAGTGTVLEVPALPGERTIARALRPFLRRMLSTVDTEADEEATAERAADEGLWLPVTRPALARWLSLVLIVDSGPSMAVWRPTARALRLLLERHGAFRDVREFLIGPGPLLRAPGSGPRHPAELLDPSGRQVYLVLTDGLGELWRDPRTARLLRLWGRSAPLAIVNPYPQDRWHRGNLPVRRARLHAARPVLATDRLLVHYPERMRNPFDPAAPATAMPVPVLELNARWIGWWARLVTDPAGWVDAAVHLVGGPPPEPPETATGPAAADLDWAYDAVLRFRATASPLAFRLATYCAAAPLHLPLLRSLQRDMLPRSAPLHLAEVVTSDLVRDTGGPEPALDFVDGVREALLACATRDESAQVIRVVAGHYRHRALAAPMPVGVIEAPDQVPDPVVTPATLPAARLELAVLNALSGPYAERARRLRRSIAVVAAGTDHDQSRPLESGDDMSGPAEPGRDDVNREPRHGRVAPPQPLPGVGVTELARLIGDAVPDTEPASPDTRTAEVGPAVWGNVPPRNPVFTGRQELLAQLERRLQAGDMAAVLPQALHGMGGVGKSQIAIEYAYRHRADYDVIWWIPSEQNAQVLNSLIELGEALGLEAGVEANTAVPRVRAALRAGTPYTNWLLVFDNAETVDAVRDYFPEAGTGKVLVTSRNQEWSQVAETLEVDVFTRAESIRLLRRRNPTMTEDDADRLAEAMGDLPLAVEHAAAWLVATTMPTDEYLALLSRKRAELGPLEGTPGYEMPVAAAANIALDRLSQENPAALQLMQVFSFFAPEPIDRSILTSPRITPIAPELDAALQNPSKLNQALRDIQRYVLARIDYRADTIQLHRLVKEVVQTRIPSGERDTVEHGAHVLLVGVNPGSPADIRQWPRFHMLASHLTASNAVACVDDWARELLINLIEFYYRWGDYETGRDLAREVVDHWRVQPGADHPQTLRAAKWLSFVLRQLGQLRQAAEINEDCLERCHRTVGPDDEQTIDTMIQVAGDYRAQGRFTDARDLDLDAFQRARRVMGENDPKALEAAYSLGVSLRLTGEFRAAWALDADNHERRLAIMGAAFPETMKTYNNLTLDARECGEYLEARRQVEDLYPLFRDQFGVQHPETLLVARNLAVSRRRAGDHDSARKLAEETMRRYREMFGPTHPEAIAATLNYAVDVREADDLVLARELAEQAATLYEAALGRRHPYALYARTNLAIVLRLMGQADESRRHNLAAWEALQQLVGPHHVLTLTCAINLASDRSVLGDHQGAYELDAECVNQCRTVVGRQHPTTLACELNLAFDLAALDRTEESERLFTGTLATYQAVLGEHHPAIAAANARVRANCDVDPMPL